jgi:hypothetical protein
MLTLGTCRIPAAKCGGMVTLTANPFRLLWNDADTNKRDVAAHILFNSPCDRGLAAW